MPTYRVTDSITGKTLRLTGDSPPTEQELEEIFRTVGGEVTKAPERRVGGFLGVGQTIPESEFERGGRTVIGNIFERPAAMTRAAIREQPSRILAGPAAGLLGLKSERVQRAAILPQAEETFQEELGRKKREESISLASKRRGILSPTTKFGGAVAGIEAAISETAGELVGMGKDILTNPADAIITLVTGGVGKAASGTKAGKVLGRFLTKERGAAGRGVFKKIKDAFRNIKNPKQFAQKVRANLFENNRRVGQTFEKEVAALSNKNLNKTIDLSPEFRNLKSAMDDATNNPGLASEIRSTLRKVKNPQDARFINSLIENPEGAKELTLQQAQNAKNIIQKAPSIARKSAQGQFANWQAGDFELLDLVDDIRLAQSDVFPEIAEIRKPYAEFKQSFKTVKNSFKPGKLIGKLKQGFGDEEIVDMIKTTLSDDVVKEIKGFRQGARILEAGKQSSKTLLKYGGIGAAAGGGYFSAKRLLD